MKIAPHHAPASGKIHPHFPDFFIVGAPKCGTTSLHAWLKDHPSLHMPEKEPGFFSQDILPLGKMLHGYLALFSGRRDDQVIGDASPKHLYSALGLREIARLNPQARIIVTLRPPVDLVKSWHGHMVRQGADDVIALDQAWRLADERRAGRCLPRMCPSPAMLDYPRWGGIGARLADTFDVFERHQVLVLLLEEIANDAARTYVRVLEHLGVDDDGRREFPVLNQRREIRSPAFHRAVLALRRASVPLLQPLYALRGGRGTGVFDAFWRLNGGTKSGAAPLSPAFRAELDAFFRPEIEQIERLLGRDLSHWHIPGNQPKSTGE